MKIGLQQVQNVCGIGTGDKTCSYLAVGAAWECMKGTPTEQLIIERRGRGSINAMGDNCSGPPNFTEET